MLVIRKEQVEVLSKYMVEQFVDSSLVHLKTNFPAQTKEMPDADLRTLIHNGIKNAEVYDVTIEEDVLRYLELMLIYGVDFDTNPETAWAGEILNLQDVGGSEKIERLDHYIKSNLKEHHGREKNQAY